ncbi:MAG: N-methyl-L-tryptophan oxidase [Thaumarchaeota archaeon]|nr:N-methyl-L-tryptophan oxidase [Nitrososphaerota archaeon]
MKHYDVIVAGVGGMGSSITYHLAEKGLKTLALERYELNHANGSSHGETRGMRTAYYEHPGYLPLINRALQLWVDLQKKTEKPIIRMTGGVAIGNPEGTLVGGQIAAAKKHRFPHEVLSPGEANDRFQCFHVSKDELCFYTPGSGILWPENSITIHAKLAEEEGAELHFDEPLVKWREKDGKVFVSTKKGEYSADKLVFSTGAWLPQLVAEVKLPLTVERQVLFWFKPVRMKEAFGPDRMPAFNWQEADGRIFYGVANVGSGVKVARHHGGKTTTPQRVSRKVTKADGVEPSGLVRIGFPNLDPNPAAGRVCLYTNAPDNRFVIDFYPGSKNVIIASPCSGHGFKFSTVVGEVVAELALKGRSKYDLGFVSIARFKKDTTK